MNTYSKFHLAAVTIFSLFFYWQFSFGQTYESAFFESDKSFNNGAGYSNGDNFDGDLTWGASNHMMGFIAMYRATKDRYYLKRLITYAKNVIKQRDDNQDREDYRGISGPTWISKAFSENSEPYAWVAGSGMIVYPMADFAQMIINSTELHNEISNEGNTFLAEANWLVDQIELTISAHADQWDEEIGVYRFRNTNVICCPGEILPHNQYAAMGRALLMMYLATKNQDYLEKVTALASYFKNYLKIDTEKDAYYWDYRDPNGWTEDISHAAIDVNFAYLCYQNNILFTETDMKRFANTFLYRLYLEPGVFAYYLDGTSDPSDSNNWFWTLQSARSLCLSVFAEDIYQTIADIYIERALYYTPEKSGSLLLGLANCNLYKKLLNPIVPLRYTEQFGNTLNIEWSAVTVGDYDKNGKNEIILADQNKGQFYQFGFDQINTKLKLSEVTNFNFSNGGAKWAGISTGDFEDDGVVEFVGVNNRDGQFYLFAVENRKIVQKAVTQLGSPSYQWAGISAGNFDRDEADEFVAADNRDGRFYIFEVANGKIVQKVITQLEDSSYQWAGICAGDFDNDGTAEIVGINSLDEQFYMFELINDTLVKKKATHFMESNSEWVGITSGDFDQDGVMEFASMRKLDGDVHFLEFESEEIKLIDKEPFPQDFNLTVIGSGKVQNPNGTKDDLILIRGFDFDVFVYETLLKEDQVTTSVDTGSKSSTFDFIKTWYPNPSDEILYVELKENISQKYQLEIVDSMGRHMINLNQVPVDFNQKLLKIDIKNFETGIYYLKLTLDKVRVQTIKFIKK